jgi:hypothetical protein
MNANVMLHPTASQSVSGRRQIGRFRRFVNGFTKRRRVPNIVGRDDHSLPLCLNLVYDRKTMRLKKTRCHFLQSRRSLS